jgi:hypothetical protein
MRRPISGPAADVERNPAYLFECPQTGFFGITLDAAGNNLSQAGCGKEWVRRAEFPLGVHEAVPAPIDPEPFLAALRERGYCVWREEGPIDN